METPINRIGATVAGLFMIIAASGFGGAVAAKEQPEIKALEAILPAVPGASACYSRVYDTQHLIAHPYQQVAAMVFLLRAEGLDKNGEETLKEPDRFVYSFALSILRRSESRVLRASGDCFGEARANCSVTCDGGGFAVEKSSHGVMVRLSGEGVGLGADCDTTRGVFVGPGVDDRAFQLELSAPDACKELDKITFGK